MTDERRILSYFTFKGAKEAYRMFKPLVDSEFNFDTSGIKQRLIEIKPTLSAEPEGYYVLFISDTKILNIFNFMELNREINYNFDDFESIQVVR